MEFEQIKFKTADGTQLHARVYHAQQLGPGVIMCPGFNCVLEMMNLPQCAQELQRQGITTLLYDPRSIGASGGEPRNNIDPPQFVCDMVDAFTHLLTLPSVDASKAGVFGFSFGATLALTAAAVDPRCRFVIAVAPLTDLDFTSIAQRTRVLNKCVQDRVSQVRGNAPFTVPMVNERGESSVGFGHGYDAEQYAMLAKKGRGFAPGHVNQTTLMTYFKIAMWVPWPLWKTLGSNSGKAGLRGILWVVPENDTMSYAEVQRSFYHELPSTQFFQKKKIEVAGAGHEDVFNEKHFGIVTPDIIGFIKKLFLVSQ